TTGGGTSGCRQDETWLDRNGTAHIFPMPSWASNCTYPASAYASDSSGFLMVMPSYGTTQVYAPDGTLVSSWPVPQNGPMVISKDSNGNYLSGTGPTGYPAAFQDTLGRTIAQTNVGGVTLETTVPTSQGSALFQPTWTSITLNTHFQWSGVSECTATPGTCGMQVMRSLSLPDGSTYYFTYDCDSSTGNVACSSPHSQTYY